MNCVLRLVKGLDLLIEEAVPDLEIRHYLLREIGSPRQYRVPCLRRESCAIGERATHVAIACEQPASEMTVPMNRLSSRKIAYSGNGFWTLAGLRR